MTRRIATKHGTLHLEQEGDAYELHHVSHDHRAEMSKEQLRSLLGELLLEFEIPFVSLVAAAETYVAEVRDDPGESRLREKDEDALFEFFGLEHR